MLTTTTNEILKHEPCYAGWKVLTGQDVLEHGEFIGNDDVLTIQDIIKSNGTIDAFWALRVFSAGTKHDARFVKLSVQLYELKKSLIDREMFGAKHMYNDHKENERMFDGAIPHTFVFICAVWMRERIGKEHHAMLDQSLTELLEQFVNDA